IESRTISDFYIGVLSVLAIVLSVVIGMAATVGLGKNPVGPDRVLANGDPGSADDYIEGLARLGIVKLHCVRHAHQLDHAPTCSQEVHAARGVGLFANPACVSTDQLPAFKKFPPPRRPYEPSSLLATIPSRSRSQTALKLPIPSPITGGRHVVGEREQLFVSA